MTYATVSDVADWLGRTLSDLSAPEQAQIQAWLSRVEGRIATRVPDLATRAMSPAYLATVVGVEIDVVIRRFNNPEGKESERVDDYAYGRNAAAARADLWPTDDEWAELLPVTARGAFSIHPLLST